MQLGMIGLGRMGANMVRRLTRGGHECVVFDMNPDSVAQLAKEGAAGSSSFSHCSRLRSIVLSPAPAGVRHTGGPLLLSPMPNNALGTWRWLLTRPMAKWRDSWTQPRRRPPYAVRPTRPRSS